MSYGLLAAIILLLFVGFASGLFWWNLRTTLREYALKNVETAESLSLRGDGRLVLTEDLRGHRMGWLRDRVVEIRDFDSGQVLCRNERLGTRSLGGPPFAGEGTGYSPRTIRLTDGTRVFVISHVHDLDGRKLLIRQGYDLDSLLLRLREFIRNTFAVHSGDSACSWVCRLSNCQKDSAATGKHDEHGGTDNPGTAR